MYQIIKNGEVIELQEKLSWVKYQVKNDIVTSCDEDEGQGILCGAYTIDETGASIWHENSVIYSVVGKPQCQNYEHVEIKEIKWYPLIEQQRILGIELSEREIEQIIQGQQISDLEIQLLELQLGGI